MRIAFENAHGEVFQTAEYAVPAVMRDRTLQYAGRTYEQARQTPEGLWVYRAMHGAMAHGAGAHDPHLQAFRAPADPDWDGPAVPAPADLTFPQLLVYVDTLVSEQRPVTLDTLRDLRARILAAYRALGYGG